MSEYRFECALCERNVQIIDQLMETLLNHEHVAAPERFCFAIHELVINSGEALKRLECSEEQRWIVLCLSITGDWLTFSLNDRGGGIPEPEPEFETTMTEALESLNERGRGLALVQALTDTFAVNAEEDGSHTYEIILKRHREE